MTYLALGRASDRPTHTTSPSSTSGSVAALMSNVRVGYAALSGWSELRISMWPETSTRAREPPSVPVNGPSLVAKIRPAAAGVGASRSDRSTPVCARKEWNSGTTRITTGVHWRSSAWNPARPVLSGKGQLHAIDPWRVPVFHLWGDETAVSVSRLQHACRVPIPGTLRRPDGT